VRDAAIRANRVVQLFSFEATSATGCDFARQEEITVAEPDRAPGSASRARDESHIAKKRHGSRVGLREVAEVVVAETSPQKTA